MGGQIEFMIQLDGPRGGPLGRRLTLPPQPPIFFSAPRSSRPCSLTAASVGK